MSEADNSPVTASVLDLNILEARIDELIQTLGDVSVENTSLRAQQVQLMAERSALIEKSELARTRVEAMIARLRAMEISS